MKTSSPTSQEKTEKIRVQETNEAPATTMAERMDAAAELRGMKVLKAEMIAGALSFEDLQRMIAEIDVMYGKKAKTLAPERMKRSEEVTSYRILDYTSRELLDRVKAAAGLINELEKHRPENLGITVSELPTEMTARFNNIPEENGLRAKVMELYEAKRLSTLPHSENSEALEKPADAVAIKSPEVSPSLEAKTPSPLPEEAKEKKETVVIPPETAKVESMLKIDLKNDPSLKKLEIDYLRSITEYRNKLKAASNSIREERGRTDFISRIKRFVGRSPRLSDKDMEELENLRHIPVLIRDQLLSTTRALVTNDGGDPRSIKLAIYDTEMRLKADLKSLSDPNGSSDEAGDDADEALYIKPTIPTEGETREYERIAFGGKMLSSSKISRNQTYEEYLQERRKEHPDIEELKPSPLQKTKEPVSPAKVEASPEKTLAALKLIENMKSDSKNISTRATEIMRTSGRVALDAFKSVGAWYNKRSKTEKIALACSIAAISLSGAVIGGALGAKFLASALVARNVKQGVLAAGITATTEAALAARAERRSRQGLKEDMWVKHKELASLGAGLLYFVGGKIASSFVSGEVQAIMKKFHSATSAIVTPEIPPVHVEPVHEIPSTPVVPLPEVHVPEIVPEPVPEPIPDHVPETMPEKMLDKPPALPPDLTLHEQPLIPEETPAVKNPITQPHSTPKEHLHSHATHKSEITINDKLGTKGDSLWGSLRHYGVSERAIANYEKLHPHSILKLAHDKDKFSFSYNEKTDTLKEVKLESIIKKATGKVAKIAASHTIENHTDTPHPQGSISKDAMAKSHISNSYSSGSGKDSILFEGAENDRHAMSMHKTLPTRDSFGGMNREGAIEVKHYFKNLEGKAWRELRSVKASDVISSKSPQALRDIIGKSTISLQDARSGKDLIKPFLKAKITPKLNEKLSAYISRASVELLKRTK